MNPVQKQKSAGELLARALEVKALVDYQAGATVSRELVSRKTGTITIFAFDEGQGLSEHTAPFDALVFIADGETEITISVRVHRLKEGQMIIMPAHEPHALKALKRFKMMLVMIRS